MTTLPQEKADILGKPAFAHVATLGPQGEPQNNPVWIDWDGEFVKFSQTTKRQKYRNLRRDPRVAISVYDPDNPYDYVEIRGRLERVEDDEANAFINQMAKKYLNQHEYPWTAPGERRVIMYVRPEHTTSM